MKNKEKKNHIVSFSGGKDSTAMLLMMLQKNMPIDEIIFCDTGMEFPQMYDHIYEIEYYINRPIKILKPEYTFEYYMKEYMPTKGKRKGISGLGWMTMSQRWCTYFLKERVMNKYLADNRKNCIEYHGIAFDEPKRINKNKHINVKYPLFEWKITEKQALEFCYNHGFNWGGLYEHFDRVSCWCCPFSNLKELRALRTNYPKLWNKLKDMETKSHNTFRYKVSVFDLDRRFTEEDKQILLH